MKLPRSARKLIWQLIGPPPAPPPPPAEPPGPRSQILSIEQYDQLEQEASTYMSVPVLQAYRPVTYQSVGFPVRVRDERELARYADHNFESEVPALFQPGHKFPPVAYVNAFTADERALFDRVRDAVVTLTATRFGRPVRPITNLMVQMGPFRILHEIARVTGKPSLDIYEVGPGLGYLGALLGLAGHRYTSFDVTQALYLWQNRLLDALFREIFIEAAGGLDIPALTTQMAHMPWWQFSNMLGRCPLRADIVYSNSNLGEMSLLALKHLLHIGRDLLHHSDIGLFMFMSTGALAQSTKESLAVEFAQFGYRQVCAEPFHAYVVGDRDVSHILAAFKNGVPHYSPSGAPATLTANEVMALNRAEAPLDWHISAWNHGWQAPFRD
jgi:hypothetical protein